VFVTVVTKMRGRLFIG